MTEYDLLIEEMKEKAINWQVNLLNSLTGWNPRKIETQFKHQLLNISLTILSEGKIKRLKSILEVQ